jgi:hypothetical protein
VRSISLAEAKDFEAITGKGYWDGRNKKIALGNKKQWRKLMPLSRRY